MSEFVGFNSLSRLYREIIITEKLDGTNAQVCINEDGTIQTGSRNRWITPEQDNYGFARFVAENEEEFRKLGVGRHFGEWWGNGIQRGYGQDQKRFSLFNTGRWAFNTDSVIETVPVLYAGMFSDEAITAALNQLKLEGSRAAPGFMNPEGVVIWHTHGRHSYKVTLDNNDKHKWESL